MNHIRSSLMLMTALGLAIPAGSAAQPPETTGPPAAAAVVSQPPGPAYTAIDAQQRVSWIVSGTVGPRSLGVGVLASAWQTGWNIPEEWGRTWNGSGKRYLAREADVAISNAMEAGLGAIWGEDPRYIPAPRGSLRSRIGYAAKTVMLAPRRDGRLALAWGRYAGNTLNNVIENSWLPPSMTTPTQTVVRSASGLLGRLIGNLWDEFWPDLRKRITH
jgi:hypothetical protein